MRGRILLEVGRFDSESMSEADLSEAGFVLYDGSSSGELAFYRRKGVNKRWDWGPSGNDYAFVLEPDGTGRFLDFSNLPERETSTTPDSLYHCAGR